MTGTAFCGNCPVDPTLLSLVHNEVLQLSSSLEDFVCQFKEQNDVLKSQVLEVTQNLEELLELPQKFKEMKNDVETLKQQMADLSCSAMKRQQSVNPPSFFGALERNGYFTGRKKELESLDSAFQDVTTTEDVLKGCKKRTKVHGICGLGGCGKSSLAFEYAWRNLERYSGGVYVINGESDELLRSSVQGIHGQFVYKSQPNKHEEAKQFDQLMTETLSWLSSLRHKWLLLVDNMDQKKLSSYTRKMFLGQWKNKTVGDILVTSRRSPQALCEDLDLRPENCLELDAFSVDESIEFLKKRTGLASALKDQEEGIKELSKVLDGLPLALEQAAAYICALKCSAQSYLEQYREQKSVLLNRKSAKPCSEVYSDARLAVQTTWLLNFSYIENDETDEGLGKAASFFMKIVTYLSPDEIPIEILNGGAPEIEHKYLKDRLKMPIGAEQIVDLLLRFSLFNRKSDDSLSIHRLVQETLKERYGNVGETEKAFSSAIRMLHHAFLDCVGGTDFLYEWQSIQDYLTDETVSHKDRLRRSLVSLQEAKLESGRWKTLSMNAFHLIHHLLENSCLQPDYLFREETARIFCEVAFYCYSLGMNSEGYRLQQHEFEILCAVKKCIWFYKGDELMKVTRVLRPLIDPCVVVAKLTAPSTETIENVCGETGFKTGTTQSYEFLERIEIIEQKAREAFSSGDYQASSDLYTEIINLQITVNHPSARPLGRTFCNRGIANMQLKNIETALEDFNASIYADTEFYRGYYWKAYALCKLVESGRTEFTSRAQAAAAVLHYKFARSKAGDIRKLQHKFSGLLDRINYNFVTNVNQLKELESQLSEERNSDDSLTVILAEGKFDLNKIVLSDRCYYFVCLPGGSAVLSFSRGLFLSDASFLFENVHFENSLPLANRDQPLSSEAACSTEEREELLSITLGKSHLIKKEVTAGSKGELYALIEANDVKSLVMDNCSVNFSNGAGLLVAAHHRQQVIVSVRSTVIQISSGPGIFVGGGTADSHISICDCQLYGNSCGIVMITPARFYMENNRILYNPAGCIKAAGGCNGGLLRNVLTGSQYAILLKGSNATVEENVISEHSTWGIVVCAGSNLICKQTTFENNCCGGLRVMLNGRGNVLVNKCDFRKNLGPDVFPANAKEICPLDLQCKELFTSLQESPITFYLSNFLHLAKTDKFEHANEFKSPLLLENRFSDVPDVLRWKPLERCSGCWKDLQSVCDVIECSSCLVARYCGRQCSDTARDVHSFVCNSILEANKECQPLQLLFSSPIKAACKRKAGNCLCLVTALFSVSGTAEFCGRICLLTCPQRNLHTVLKSADLHSFVMIHGALIKESMMDIKAASILANFDPVSDTVTVYWHRIFPVDKVPNGWNWVNRSLDLFAKSCSREGAS